MQLPSTAADCHDDLQRSIWLTKIARAKAMTPDQRFAEMVSLTTQAFDRMHAAAMHELHPRLV